MGLGRSKPEEPPQEPYWSQEPDRREDYSRQQPTRAQHRSDFNSSVARTSGFGNLASSGRIPNRTAIPDPVSVRVPKTEELARSVPLEEELLPSKFIPASIKRPDSKQNREPNLPSSAFSQKTLEAPEQHKAEEGISKLDYVILVDNVTQLTDTVKDLNKRVSELEALLLEYKHLPRVEVVDVEPVEQKNSFSSIAIPDDMIRRMKEQLRKRKPDLSALEENRNLYKKIKQDSLFPNGNPEDAV